MEPECWMGNVGKDGKEYSRWLTTSEEPEPLPCWAVINWGLPGLSGILTLIHSPERIRSLIKKARFLPIL